MKYWRITFLLGGAALFFVVARNVPFGDFVQLVRTLDWKFAALAFASYCAVNAARVERMTLLLKKQVLRSDLYTLIVLQSFFNVFLPFAGDAAYLSFLHKKKNIPLGANVGSFVSAKIMDLMALAAVFGGAVFFADLPPLAMSFRAAALAIMAVSAAAAIAFFACPAAARIALWWLAGKLGVRSRPAADAFFQKIEEISNSLVLLDRRDIFASVAFWTIVNWSCTFLSGFFLLRGAGVALGAGGALFAYTFPIVATLTPLHVFGGFGTYEVSFASGLILAGISTAQASAAAIAIHLQELGFLIVSAAAGAAIYFFGRNR